MERERGEREEESERERGGKEEKDGEREGGGREGEREREGGREGGNSNSKSLFYKDWSLGSVKNLSTTSPC